MTRPNHRQDFQRRFVGAASAVPTTARLTSVEQLSDSVVHVTAAFSRVPSSQDIEREIARNLGTGFEPVPESWRKHVAHSMGNRTVLSGHARRKEIVREVPKDAEAAGFKEIASNVYMDAADKSVWQLASDGQLHRTTEEDISELVATASTSIRRTERQTAVASVQGLEAEVAQIMAYVNLETATVDYGVRVSDGTIWSTDRGIVEVSQLQVVDVEYVHNMGAASGVEVAATMEEQNMIDYYAKVFAADPDYVAQVEEIIRNRSAA